MAERRRFGPGAHRRTVLQRCTVQRMGQQRPGTGARRQGSSKGFGLGELQWQQGSSCGGRGLTAAPRATRGPELPRRRQRTLPPAGLPHRLAGTCAALPSGLPRQKRCSAGAAASAGKAVRPALVQPHAEELVPG